MLLIKYKDINCFVLSIRYDNIKYSQSEISWNVLGAKVATKPICYFFLF